MVSEDGDPSVDLTGIIPARGYYLLERDDDSTISNVPADQVYSGVLNNTGESLTLRDGAATVVDTANDDGGAWPEGEASP